MPMERMTFTVDIRPGQIGPRQVNVRSSMLIANFIVEIQDKYNLDGTLDIFLQGGDQALGPSVPIEQSGLTEGGVLICERKLEETGTKAAIERGVREALAGEFQRIYLVEERSLIENDVTWQPAIIGRRDHRDPSKNRLLAIDLEEMEDLPTVSRHHACITQHDGGFYLEQLQARNPTYLDGARLREGVLYPLGAGAKIQVGGVALTFYIVS
jgi:hypothetical protein